MITYGLLHKILMAVDFLIAVIFVIFTIRMIRRKAEAARVVAACLLMLYTIEAFGICFFPFFYNIPICGSVTSHGNLIPFHSIIGCFQNSSAETAVRQILGSVVIFLPIGLLVPIVSEKFRSAKNILLFSLLLSVGVEAVRFLELLITYLPNRAFDVDNVILEFIGGSLGYLLFLAIRKARKSHLKKAHSES